MEAIVTGAGAARADHGRDHGTDGHHRGDDRAPGARLLRQGARPTRCWGRSSTPGSGIGSRICAQMCAFWSSVALMTGRYHGTPMAKHLPLPVDAGHFDRWLELFEASRPRDLSARGGSAFRGAGAADRGEPRTRHRRRAGRHARQRRTISAQRGREQSMSQSCACRDRTRTQADPYSGSSLVPMLVDRACADLCGDDCGARAELRAFPSCERSEAIHRSSC